MLFNGHYDAESAAYPDSSAALDSVIHERIYMAPGVKRIPVRSGKIRGVLFLPSGSLFLNLNF